LQLEMQKESISSWKKSFTCQMDAKWISSICSSKKRKTI